MSAEVLLQAAATLGERLVASAVRHEDRCTWLAHDVDEAGTEPVVVEVTAGPDLYQGTAGIGWALARLAAVTGDVETATVARAALRHARARAPADVSLHGGRAGIAYALADAGSALGDGGLLAAGREMAFDVAGGLAAGAAAAEARGGAPRGWDVMGGLAGVALALAAFELEPLTDAAVLLARELVAAATVDGDVRSWSAAGAVEPPLCGLGHGAGGAAAVLSVVGRAAGIEDFDDTVAGALRYERTWLDPGAGWPDLRGLDRLAVHSGRWPGYPVHWCHGAAGAGIARLVVLDGRAAECPWRRPTLAEIGLAVEVSTLAALHALAPARAAPGNSRPSPLANVSICHGIGSVVELHLAAYRATGDAEHLRHGRRLLLRSAGVATETLEDWENGTVTEADIRAVLGELPGGIPDAPEVPGLMVGTAGVVVLLLRLADPWALDPVGLPQRLGSLGPGR